MKVWCIEILLANEIAGIVVSKTAKWCILEHVDQTILCFNNVLIKVSQN